MVFITKENIGFTAGIAAAALATGYFLGRKKYRSVNKNYLSNDPILTYANKHSLRLTQEQKELIELTRTQKRSGMLSSADEIQLLQNIAIAIGAKNGIDIGVYTGYSSMSIALALPDDGKVIACDINDTFPNVGKPIWKKAGVDHKIDLRIAPAVETLENLLANGGADTFDFAFIDADKENYENYYELCLKLVRPGGLIAVDNVLWRGKVCDDNKMDSETVSLRKFNSKLANDPRINISLLKLGDGTTLAFRKD